MSPSARDFTPWFQVQASSFIFQVDRQMYHRSPHHQQYHCNHYHSIQTSFSDHEFPVTSPSTDIRCDVPLPFPCVLPLVPSTEPLPFLLLSQFLCLWFGHSCWWFVFPYFPSIVGQYDWKHVTVVIATLALAFTSLAVLLLRIWKLSTSVSSSCRCLLACARGYFI